MLKLLVLLVVLGGTAAAIAWAPVHGRTVLARWRAAPDARSFLSSGYDEAKAAIASRDRPRTPARTARAHKAPQRPAPRPGRPTESHTDEDRATLDRIVAEHANR